MGGASFFTVGVCDSVLRAINGSEPAPVRTGHIGMR